MIDFYAGLYFYVEQTNSTTDEMLFYSGANSTFGLAP